MAISEGMATLLLVGALALSLATLATPAAAQSTCVMADQDGNQGPEGTATGAFSMACGEGAVATSGVSTALGTFSNASELSSTAIGFNASATHAFSVAIGAGYYNANLELVPGATTTRDYQFVIGLANQTYTLAGITSDASAAAQAGATYMVTTDSDGNLAASTFDLATLENLPDRMDQAEQSITNLEATVSGHSTTLNQHETRLASHQTRITQTEQKNVEQDTRLGQHDSVLANHETRITSNTEMLNLHGTQIIDLDSRVTANTNDITMLDSRVGALETGFNRLDGRIDQAFEGAAMAMAMAGASLPADKNYAVSINWGNFEGKSAFAGTAQARVSENFLIHGGIGYGASTGSVGGRAGLTFAW